MLMSVSVALVFQQPLSLQKRDGEAAFWAVQGVTGFLNLGLKLRDYVIVLLPVAIVIMGMATIAQTNVNTFSHFSGWFLPVNLNS